MRILRNPNTTILFINAPTEFEIAEENFVRKIAVHRLFFKHPFHVFTTLWIVSWFSCCLYMDVGVDLNAIYAIMCRKTALVPENDEESTHYNSDIFSGTSERIRHRPFNICNHSSLLKILHNFSNYLRSWAESPFL